jgi:Fe-S cluster assembly ATP-binding protein
MQPILEIKNLSVARGDKNILSNVSFSLGAGEILLLSGANGSGKSTLAKAIMGFPECMVDGSILFNGTDMTTLPTFERARKGIFLAHQELPAIPGVSAVDVLRASAEAMNPAGFSLSDFYTRLRSNLDLLGLTLDFAKKELHVAFSGGEKKKIELLSLLMASPNVAILDELDAGMDTDARDRLILTIRKLQASGTAFLLISHHPDLFRTFDHTREFALS